MTAHTADWDGATYHRVSEPQFAWGQRVLARLELRGDETVVDAGCGSGRLTAELLDRLPEGRVIAVDSSASMLAVAERELAPRYGDRVGFLHADLLDLDRVADVVFSTATFHWVLDHPLLFTRLHRALRPGGRLLAQCGGAGNLDRARSHARELVASPEFAPSFEGWRDPWEYADAETTRQRLETAGFDDVVTSMEPAPTLFEREADYREFVSTVILRTFLSRLTNSASRDSFLDAMTAAAGAEDPPFCLDYQRLNMSARRPAS